MPYNARIGFEIDKKQKVNNNKEQITNGKAYRSIKIQGEVRQYKIGYNGCKKQYKNIHQKHHPTGQISHFIKGKLIIKTIK